MPSLVLLGGTGFLGRALVNYLKSSHQLIQVSRHPPVSSDKNVQWIQGDYCDPNFVLPPCEWLVHMATPSHPSLCTGDTSEVLVNYAAAFERVLNQLPPNSRMLYVSSIHVYSPQNVQPMREDALASPAHLYGQIKRQDELALLLSGRGIVVRPAQLFGFPPPPRSILSDWLPQIHGPVHKPVFVGNLTLVRDFVHVADAAEAIEILLNTPGAEGIFNIGSGTAIALSELAEALGLSERCVQDPLKIRGDEAPVWLAEPMRLNQLGWFPKRDIRMALRHFAAGYQSV